MPPGGSYDLSDHLKCIDLNCDMGEGCPNDAELMDLVSSANIACGFHAGDAETMKRTVDLALERHVAIGAHPGYPDRNNFGRIPMSLLPGKVYDLVTHQIEALHRVCDGSGAAMVHVKPHGALYNQASVDAGLAAVIAKAVRDFDASLVLFGLSGSFLLAEGKRAGLRTASEVFADRTYTAEGCLTPRTEPNALIRSVDQALVQAIRMMANGSVLAIDGTVTPVNAQTICIHSDGENAVAFARAIHRKLREFGVRIRPA